MGCSRQTSNMQSLKRIEQSKGEVLLAFAKRVPNYQSASYDSGRDVLAVWFDGIHCWEYKASEILNKWAFGLEKQGYTVTWIA